MQLAHKIDGKNVISPIHIILPMSPLIKKLLPHYKLDDAFDFQMLCLTVYQK